MKTNRLPLIFIELRNCMMKRNGAVKQIPIFSSQSMYDSSSTLPTVNGPKTEKREDKKMDR